VHNNKVMKDKQETKSQHYIPVCYLKNFYSRYKIKVKKIQYYTSVIDKLQNDKNYEPNIEGICCENNFYTLEGTTEEDRQIIENFYNANIESDYNEVYKILADENKKEIIPAQRVKIITTIISLYYRTPKWPNTIDNMWSRIIDSAESLMKQPGTKKILKLDDGSEINFEGKTSAEIKKEIQTQRRQEWILTHLKYIFALINGRLNHTICVNKITDDHEFITSDNPVLMSNGDTGHIMPFHKENMIRLPIDSKHTVLIMPASSSDGEDLNKIYRRNLSGTMCFYEVGVCNMLQYQTAERLIIGKKSALAKFIAMKPKFEGNIPEDKIKDIRERMDQIKQKMQAINIKANKE
jgi:hypothetical protein